MTIAQVAVSDSGATVRAKINAAIDKANLVDDKVGSTVLASLLSAKASTTALQVVERALRAADSQAAAVVDTKLLAKADASTSVLIDEQVSWPSRPGEARRFWTSVVEGAGGASIPSGWVVTDTDGAVARVPAGNRIASKQAVRLEAGRVYQLRAVVRRRVDPVDPAQDGVVIAVRWLGAGKGALAQSTTKVATLVDLSVSAGRRQVIGYLSTGNTGENWTSTPPDGAPPPGKAWLQSDGAYLVDGSGAYIYGPDGSGLHIAPAATRYCRPYVEVFGSAAADVEVIELLDVTRSVFLGQDVSIFDSRLQALEGFDAGSRLTAIEQVLATPTSGTYASREHIEVATVPLTVNTIRSLRDTDAGPVAPAEWARADVEPSHPGKVQSADGAWWELVTSQVSVLMFGAMPYDEGQASTNRDAFQRAASCLRFGGKVLVPRATYYISGDPIVTPDGVSIEGDDAYASAIITTQPTGYVVRMGAGSYIANVKITSSVDRTANAYVHMMSNGCEARKCEFNRYFLAVEIGDDTTMIVRPTITQCGFSLPSVGVGSGAVLARFFSNLIISENVASGPVIGAVQPDWGFRLLSGDTAYLTNNNVTLHGTALLMDPGVNQNLYAVSSVGCTWDSAGEISNGSMANSAQISPRGGGIFNTKMTGDWYGLSLANGLLVTVFGSGSVDGLTFGNCEWMDNDEIGCQIAGPNVRNVRIVGGQSGGNGSHAFAISDAELWSLIAVGTGDASGRGKNLGFGLYLSGANDNYSVVANDFLNNEAGGCNDRTNSDTKVFRFNLGAPDEACGTASVTFDANGFGAIEHGLGQQPRWAGANVLYTADRERAMVYSVSATQIIVRLAATNDNANIVGGPWSIMWEARL